MFGSFISVAVVALAAATSAAPASLDERAATCTFSGASGATAVASAKSSCPTITLNSLVVPAGKTLDLTKLAKGTHVIFQGTTTFGYSEWAGPLVSVSGDSLTIDGTGAILDGNGARWWDGQGSNGGKNKPKFFFAHSMTNSVVKGLTIKDSPVQVYSINGATNVQFNGLTIDNKNGNTKGGHNTDGFDIGSSSEITISGATVYNQDDCLAINSGSQITFTGGYCSGGHGLSIGSVGNRDDNTVDTVNILNSQIVDSDNGVRVKSIEGATGKITGVTYSNIKLTNIAKYGIVVEQDYRNGSPSGNPTGNVPITGLTIKGVTGTVGSNAVPVYILCAKGACSGWTWSGNSITGGKKSTKCSNVPSPAAC